MKLASAYKREKKIYLSSASKTTVGVWIETGPIIAIEESDPASNKGACLREVLSHSQEGAPHPTSWDHLLEPLLNLAGVTSWYKFAKSAVSCVIELEGHQLQLIPHRNLGPRGGYVQIQDRKMVIPFDASDEELGILLEKAFEACE